MGKYIPTPCNSLHNKLVNKCTRRNEDDCNCDDSSSIRCGMVWDKRYKKRNSSGSKTNRKRIEKGT